MLRTLSLAGLWAVETNIRTRRRALLREYKELRNHRHLWICHNAFVVNPARKTHSIYNNYSLKHEKKNGAPCFRKLIFLSQKFRHLKTITYKSMQNCWYSTFDIKEALNERKKCYQNLFSNERIFKQKKHMAYLWTSKSRLWGAQTASKSMEQLNGWISERHLS